MDDCCPCCGYHEPYERIKQLEADCLTMALRLLGEYYDSFSLETMEVMERWGPKAMAQVEGKERNPHDNSIF